MKWMTRLFRRKPKKDAETLMREQCAWTVCAINQTQGIPSEIEYIGDGQYGYSPETLKLRTEINERINERITDLLKQSQETTP